MKSTSTIRFQGIALITKIIAVPLTLIIALLLSVNSYSQVSINNTGNPPDGDAMLDVSATNKGVLIPRVTLANRPPSTKIGMLIYQTDGNAGFYYCNGLNWVQVGDANEHFWQLNGIGNDIGYSSGKIYVGSTGITDGHTINAQNYTYGKSAVRGTEQSGSIVYSEGNLGVINWTGSLSNPLDLPVNLANIGVLGLKPPNGLSGTAVYGWADQIGSYGGVFVSDGPGSATNNAVYARSDSANTSIGLDAVANGNSSGTSYGVRTVAEGTSGTRYGLYTRAVGAGSTNYGINSFTDNGGTNYAGYFKGRMRVESHNYLNNASDSTSTLITALVTHDHSFNTTGILSTSDPQDGYGYGVQGTGGRLGVYGIAYGGEWTSSAWGVYGYASGSAGSRYGVYGNASNSGGTASYGVYGTASGATNNWAGYFVGDAYVSSDLRIATTTQATNYELSVNGQIACEEVLVEDSGSWPDFVFLEDYELKSLTEVEQLINKNGHLPGIPSAEEIAEEGILLGNMQKLVLQKVEELTLYTIEQQKLIQDLQKQIDDLKEENKSLQRKKR